MLVFLAANLGLKGDRLQSAMKTTHEIRQVDSVRALLAWNLRLRGDRTIFHHGGTTYGYHSFAGFVTETRTGVVVLSNSVHHIRDIGLHLLYPSVPLHDIAAPVEVGQVALEAS